MDSGERYGQLWSVDEATLALYLYCQIPFAQTKASHPAVKALAAYLGRTPASVARKLGNFGSFDPALAARNIVGLDHSSKLDREIWDLYSRDWEKLVDRAVSLWDGIATIADPPSRESPPEPVFAAPSGPSEVATVRKVRLHQAFFRMAVLSSYDDACCVCGIEISTLLVASHIVPWFVAERSRTDPTNGLCLCALHDRAFDRGLFTISEEGRTVASPRLSVYRSDASHRLLCELSGQVLRMPRRFSPNPDHIAWHRSNVFQAA